MKATASTSTGAAAVLPSAVLPSAVFAFLLLLLRLAGCAPHSCSLL